MIKSTSKILLCVGISACVFAHTALATDNLNADQVTALFSGKSVSGIDLEVGSPFTQFFNLNGVVLNDAQGFNPTGKWHVNKAGEHCITWDDENLEHCGYIRLNEDGTYTKLVRKNAKNIPMMLYEKFIDGDIFAQGIKSVEIQKFKQAHAGSQATHEMLQAVADQDLTRFDKAIAAGANVNVKNKEQKTVLFFAVERENGPLIEKLTQAGADINAQDSDGNTPLIVSTANNYIKMVQLLLHLGADAGIKNKERKDALTIAKIKNSRRIAQIIVENKFGGSALGVSINIKNRHITEDQFLQAAVNAYETQRWHVDKAENNTVSGSYERAGRLYKSRMIYQPDLLIIKFDSAMGAKRAHYLATLQKLFFRQIDNKNPHDANNDLESEEIYIDTKNNHTTEDQFRQAAITAFETQRWQVDKAENNTVSGTFESGYHVYKGSMIYHPNQLIIKLDSTTSGEKENQLYALRNQYFRHIVGKNYVDEVAIYVDIKNKHISEEQFRRAAVSTLEAYNWRVDKTENNMVRGTFERGDRVYKGRMIYRPEELIIKFDDDSSYKRVKLLYLLRTRFFREIENDLPQDSIFDYWQ